MISDLEISRLSSGIYGSPSPLIQWDHFNDGMDSLGVCWGVKTIDGFDVVVFRGSTDILDWVRDLTVLADPFIHGGLGPVHPGFFESLPQTWESIKGVLKNPVIFAGHSLGAARADLMAGLAILDGYHPARTVVIGEPRPAFRELVDILAPYPRAAYRTVDEVRHWDGEEDPVTGVPLSLLVESYVHPSPLIDLPVSPLFPDLWGPLRLHHPELYLQGLANLK